jgi:hypothetical protein
MAIGFLKDIKFLDMIFSIPKIEDLDNKNYDYSN